MFERISGIIQDYLIDKDTADNITQEIMDYLNPIDDAEIAWWDKE